MLAVECARESLLGVAAESGLALAFSGRGMAGDLSIPEPRHPELEFRRVQTEDDLATYGELNALAYGMPPEVGRAALAGSALWRREAYAFIGFRDGTPVSCAATIGRGDAVFLALVATAPGETRRGYGEAVTRKANSTIPSSPDQRRPTLVMSCRARTRHTYDRTRRGGRMT